MRERQKSLLLLVLAVVFGGKLLMDMRFIPAAARGAEPPNSQKTNAIQKWEYCAVTYADSIWSQGFGATGAYAVVKYFELSGNRLEKIEYHPTPAQSSVRASGYDDEAKAKAIATLGEAGWEMVDVQVTGENGRAVAYVFKRPKP